MRKIEIRVVVEVEDGDTNALHHLRRVAWDTVQRAEQLGYPMVSHDTTPVPLPQTAPYDPLYALDPDNPYDHEVHGL